jgi:hypothetical protein
MIEFSGPTGIERVQVVDTDGEMLVAVRRRGLTPEQKARLALYDNRAAELAECVERTAQAFDANAHRGLALDRLMDGVASTAGLRGDDPA